jgi:hypothetical protein
MTTPCGTPLFLHLECGMDFLVAILDRYGVAGWNRWLSAMIPYLGGVWGVGDPEPPLCFWFDVVGDLSGRNLDGIELWGVVSCDGIRLDGGSAVGATIGSCVGGSFRSADLRRATFTEAVTGADFSGANLGGASFDEATYDPASPPIGLPDALLRACREEPLGDAMGGLVEHPVAIRASISDSATG